MSSRRRTGTALAKTDSQLHVCPKCACEMVQPTEWWERNEGTWEVWRRCPECEWRGGGVHSQRTVDRFDEELDRGSQDLIEELRKLTMANMEDEVENFVTALEGDMVLPEDF